MTEVLLWVLMWAFFGEAAMAGAVLLLATPVLLGIIIWHAFTQKCLPTSKSFWTVSALIYAVPIAVTVISLLLMIVLTGFAPIQTICG